MKGFFHVATSLALVSAVASGACAMSAPVPAADCVVIGGQKLPPASGGAVALCAAIARAAGAAPAQPAFKVRINVLPRSVLSADVTLSDGRSLAPLRIVQNDRQIDEATFDRVGAALVAYVANAQR